MFIQLSARWENHTENVASGGRALGRELLTNRSVPYLGMHLSDECRIWPHHVITVRTLFGALTYPPQVTLIHESLNRLVGHSRLYVRQLLQDLVQSPRMLRVDIAQFVIDRLGSHLNLWVSLPTLV